MLWKQRDKRTESINFKASMAWSQCYTANHQVLGTATLTNCFQIVEWMYSVFYPCYLFWLLYAHNYYPRFLLFFCFITCLHFFDDWQYPFENVWLLNKSGYYQRVVNNWMSTVLRKLVRIVIMVFCVFDHNVLKVYV